MEVSDDPMNAIRAWVARMTARYGPQVWDQEWHEWLSWEEALTRLTKGPHKTWLLDTPVWDENAERRALEWEFGNWWPDWAVKAHLVDSVPCEFENHRWSLVVDHEGTRLVCHDPCAEPRVFRDRVGRYVYPACQSVPDIDAMQFEMEVTPSWVVCSDEDWWLELTPCILKSEDVESDTTTASNHAGIV